MKRTKNGRFIAKRMAFDAEEIGPALLKIKREQKWTWRQFASELGVGEHVLRFEWRNAIATIPEPIFRKLQKLNKQIIRRKYEIKSPWWGQKLGQQSRPQQAIKIPSTDSVGLAEFYGALLGDGCIYSTKNSFCITCNGTLDKSYVEDYLKPLCISIFGVNPKIYYAKNENAIRLIVNSRKIVSFLLKIGFPVGEKKNSRIIIPRDFVETEQNLSAFLRGLIDTDGGIHAHPNSEIMLEFTSVIPILTKAVCDGLSRLGIKSAISGNKVQMYGKNKISQYFSKVGSSNPKNIMKYSQFLKYGLVPNSKETENLLKEYTQKINTDR